MTRKATSILDALLAGNRRVVEAGTRELALLPELRGDPQGESGRLAALICCSECGSAPEGLFGLAPGQLFIVQGAGTRLDDMTIAGVSYAAAWLELRLVIVLAHTECQLLDRHDDAVLDLDDRAAPGGQSRAAWFARRVARQIEARPELKGLADGELSVVPLVLDVHTRRIMPA